MAKHLNLALVYSLQALLEEGSFQAAAKKLHVTPPAMSQQIKRLEGSLGFTLVQRDTSPLRLTERGEVFMLHARESLEASHRALGTRETPTLRIGFINGYPRSEDEDFMIRFREEYPDTKLEFLQLNWGEQITKLLSGDVDVSLARPPFADVSAIDFMPVHREPRVAAVPAKSTLASMESLQLADLDTLPIVRAKGIDFEWTKYWVVDPRPSGIPVNYGVWASTMEEALTAVAMSDNVMVTAQSVAERYIHPGVVYLPLDDIAYCTVELCTRKSDSRPMIGALRRIIEG